MQIASFLLPILLGIGMLSYFLYKMDVVFSKKKSFIIGIVDGVISFVLTSLAIFLNHSTFYILPLTIGSILTFILAKFLADGTISIKNVWKSIATLLLFFFSEVFEYIPILMFHLKEEDVTPLVGTYLTAFSDVCLAIIFVFMYYDDLKRGYLKCKENFMAFFDDCFRIWALGFLGMICSNIIINIFFPSAIAGNENAVQKMIDVSPLIMLLSAGVIAPIIEELTFRKAFQNVLPNPLLFILLSGIMFGFLHVIFAYQSLLDFLYVIPYSSLGIAFAYMVHKTDNILSSIMMHFLHNTALVLFSIFVGMIVL